MLARIESQRTETPAWITQLRGPLHDQSTAPGKLDQWVAETFLRTVSRPPTMEELQSARRDIAAAKDPIDGLRDLLWALLNTREFSVNH
jgi:hypothetical protein